MQDQKFDAIMTLLVPQILPFIMQNYAVDEIAASKMFYESGVYAILEQENTKLWHLSPLSIYTMFDEEQKTGKFEFPEEV